MALLSAGLDAVNRYRKIEEATAPKDDPAPVYLLDEIADMARQSPESAQAIADAVQKKLGQKNPIVKFKALRIIKHLCTKGCSQFQRCMQRHSSCVRELVHWRGEPDPFKGDVPNARVREFAKEVVEVMFNATPVQSNANTLAAQGKIQGFGSAGPDTSSRQYSGIGSSGSGSSGYGGAGFRQGLPNSIPTSLADAQRAASQLTQAAQQALGEGPLGQGLASAANALGGFLQPSGYSGRLNDSSYQDPGPEASYGSATSYAAPVVSQVVASQVLGSEEGLVEDITTPGGLRPLPDPADLRRFVDTASSMDGLRIAELLREKIESPRWQVVLRALAALQAILQRGSSQACGEVAVMFQSDPSPVREALGSTQQQVQQHAAAILKLLTGEEVQVTPKAGTAAGKKGSTAAAAANAPVADLLIDDSPSISTPAAAAAPASGIDLLGDLTEAPTAASAATPAPAAAAVPAAQPQQGAIDSLFDGLGLDSTAGAAAASSNGDLFGGLTVEPAAPAPAPAAAVAAVAPPQPAAAAVAPAAAANRQSAPLDELFSGLTTSPGVSSSSLLSSLSQPQPLQQQQQQQHIAAVAGAPTKQHDLLGSDMGLGGPKAMQPAAGFVALPGVQANGFQQQQQFGLTGLSSNGMGQWPVGGQAQVQPAFAHMGLPAQGFDSSSSSGVGGAIASNSGSGSGHGGSGNGIVRHGSTAASAGGAAWAGHDDVSNLMRQVGHGGKYDPAFDFVSDAFKSTKR